MAPGTVYVNAGTAAQVLAPVREPVAGDYFVFGRAGAQGYLAMASVYAAGLSVDWVAESLLSGPPHTAGGAGARLDAMAITEDAGAAGAVFVPHLLGTSVPAHDPRVRGGFLGLSADQLSATLARATLEGVAYACAAAVAQVEPLVEGMDRIRIGGGLSRSVVWAETMTAVHDVPVERVTGEASPVGAAMLAGIGLGAWADVHEAAATCVAVEPVRQPDPATVRRYRAGRGRYELAADALADLSHRMDTAVGP